MPDIPPYLRRYIKSDEQLKEMFEIETEETIVKLSNSIFDLSAIFDKEYISDHIFEIVDDIEICDTDYF